MALVIIGILIIFLLVLGLVGYSRDVRRGVVALAGTLLGSSLVDFWSWPLAVDLAKRLGTQPQSLRLLSSMLIFLLAVFLVGYGGGSLLGRTKARTTFGRRAAGALLGMLNAVLIVAYLVRYASVSNPQLQASILTSPITVALHDGLPLLFLMFALVVGSLVVVRYFLTLLHRTAAVPRQQAQQQAKQDDEVRRKKQLEEQKAKLQQQWLKEQLQMQQAQQAAQPLPPLPPAPQPAAQQEQPRTQRERDSRVLDKIESRNQQGSR